MEFYYTLDGRYTDRATAAQLVKFAVFWCSQRGETRSYNTTHGRLTVWVLPFKGEA